jgi:Peptidase family C54
VQEAPRRRTARINGKAISVVDISETYLRSVHTTSQEAVPLVRLDPSIALGFYCRSEEELHHLQQLMNAWTTANPSLPEIFSFAELSPDYADGNMILSSMMDDMMAGDTAGGSSLLDGEGSEEASDEEYVML